MMEIVFIKKLKKLPTKLNGGDFLCLHTPIRFQHRFKVHHKPHELLSSSDISPASKSDFVEHKINTGVTLPIVVIVVIKFIATSKFVTFKWFEVVYYSELVE